MYFAWWFWSYISKWPANLILQSNQLYSRFYSYMFSMWDSQQWCTFPLFIYYLQRFSSQERENSVKKTSFLPPVSNACEESQMPISRSTSTLMRKWNPVSIPHHKCKFSLWGLKNVMMLSSQWLCVHGIPSLYLFEQVRYLKNLSIGLEWWKLH